MSPYDISLIKLDKGYGAIQKEIKDAYPKKVCHMLRHVQNKRCIPKEGMLHAHQACQEKKWRKREEKKIAPIQRKKRNKREMINKGVHPPSTKNIHTLAHLDQGL